MPFFFFRIQGIQILLLRQDKQVLSKTAVATIWSESIVSGTTLIVQNPELTFSKNRAGLSFTLVRRT